MPDFSNGGLPTLTTYDKVATDLKYTRPNIASLLCGLDDRPVQSRLALLATTLQLLGKFAEMYKSLDGFIELYTPVFELLQSVIIDEFPLELQVCLILFSRKE
jgi:nucleolar protein 14